MAITGVRRFLTGHNTDKSNLRKAKFDALVESVSADLYRYALWLCKDKSIVEDVIQEAYLRAWKSIDQLRDADSARGWIFTIFRREFARHYEKKRLPMVPIEEVGDHSLLTSHSDPATNLVLKEALGSLPPDYRDPLLLQIIGGFNSDEIASILGLSRSNVMTRTSRARKQLRAKLADYRADMQKSGKSNGY